MEELLRVADALKRRAGQRVYILTTHDDSGVRFVIGSSQGIAKGTIHCGKIAGAGAKVLGGGGGGRPDMAQAGGKDVAKLPEAVKLMRESAQAALRP